VIKVGNTLFVFVVLIDKALSLSLLMKVFYEAQLRFLSAFVEQENCMI